MKNKKTLFFHLCYLSLFLLLFLTVSCNFFEWANPKVGGTSASDFILKGDQYYSETNYIQAADSYSKALAIDPGRSAARLGFAKSKLWGFLPDLSRLLAKQPSLNTLDILNMMNSQEAHNILFANGRTNIFQDIIASLDSPYGIINARGDQVLKPEDFEVNTLLLISYMSSFILEALDSDGNGVYCDPNDYFIYTNGKIDINLNADNIDSLVSNLLSVPSNYTVSVVLEKTRIGHDQIEDMMALCRYVAIEDDYINKIIVTIIRMSTSLRNTPSGKGYPSLYDEIMDSTTNPNANSDFTKIFDPLNKYMTIPDTIGTNLNFVHNILVGSYDFPPNGHVRDFVASPWNSHHGGFKATLDALDQASNVDITTFTNVSNQISQFITPEYIDAAKKLLSL